MREARLRWFDTRRLPLLVLTLLVSGLEGSPEGPPPTVAGVTLQGNRRFRAAALQPLLRTRPGRPLGEEDLASDRESILAKYRGDGFLLSHVETLVHERRRGRVDVTFVIQEGHRARLQEVIVRGNRSFPAAVLIAVSGLHPVKALGLLSRGYYVPGSVSGAIDNVRAFYRQHGFFDVLVELDDIRLGDRKKLLYIEIRITEGARYRLAGVELAGRKLFPEELLLERMDLETGEFYSGTAVRAARTRLLEWYQEHSDLVPSIRTRPRFAEGNEVTIVFEIEPGEHLFVGNVNISGNWRTRDEVIRRYLSVVPVDPFVPLRLDASRERLRRTGFFEAVEVRALETADRRVRDIEVAVVEKERTGYVEVGGGASTSRGEVAYVHVEFTNFDLFRLPRSLTDWRGAFTGGGQHLEVEIIPGSRESEFLARFREPALFSSRRALTLTGWSQIFERESYDETRLRGEAEVRQFFDRQQRLSLALAYRLESVDIDDLDAAAPPDVAAAKGRAFLAYPRLSLLLNDVEYNRYSGPKGFAAEARFDIAESVTGSELDFTRLSVKADVFLPVFGRHPDFRHTLHAGAELGWIEGLGEDSVPLFERFYLGGPHDLRGFDYRRLGPHQSNTPVGGQALLRGTVEYSMPLFFPEFRAVALFDWGTLESGFSNVSSSRLRTAAGGGVQLRLPFPLTKQVVPVNLYWVQALSSEPDDEEQLFTFTLGFGF